MLGNRNSGASGGKFKLLAVVIVLLAICVFIIFYLLPGGDYGGNTVPDETGGGTEVHSALFPDRVGGFSLQGISNKTSDVNLSSSRNVSMQDVISYVCFNPKGYRLAKSKYVMNYSNEDKNIQVTAYIPANITLASECLKIEEVETPNYAYKGVSVNGFEMVVGEYLDEEDYLFYFYTSDDYYIEIGNSQAGEVFAEEEETESFASGFIEKLS